MRLQQNIFLLVMAISAILFPDKELEVGLKMLTPVTRKILQGGQ
jgi:hypothetical protein